MTSSAWPTSPIKWPADLPDDIVSLIVDFAADRPRPLLTDADADRQTEADLSDGDGAATATNGSLSIMERALRVDPDRSPLEALRSLHSLAFVSEHLYAAISAKPSMWWARVFERFDTGIPTHFADVPGLRLLARLLAHADACDDPCNLEPLEDPDAPTTPPSELCLDAYLRQSVHAVYMVDVVHIEHTLIGKGGHAAYNPPGLPGRIVFGERGAATMCTRDRLQLSFEHLLRELQADDESARPLVSHPMALSSHLVTQATLATDPVLFVMRIVLPSFSFALSPDTIVPELGFDVSNPLGVTVDDIYRGVIEA